MSDNYTFIVHTPGPYADPVCATRHEAVGEKTILDAIHGWNTEIGVRKRYATDPV